ncbi:hypothetical protein AMAG_09472 [Allomyces macrogynus ATCC 38327]|uniref:Uncharacterized protein n=1 Tax=Allomyces macrogynus (strain ATCC 38327) TaxID=578462 RepID=A0A0L0SPK4_ALLM3|nr:hypothetical protein AMAG_09472 [Allomyces macrogynus ATCC 38327]|eukprot:KNE64451.1 hypothetical protein AMAG_09472 [Allomyces macrogynus ATCC 38327]
MNNTELLLVQLVNRQVAFEEQVLARLAKIERDAETAATFASQFRAAFAGNTTPEPEPEVAEVDVMEVDDAPAEEPQESPEPAQVALPELVLRPLLDTYVAEKNKTGAPNTKDQRVRVARCFEGNVCNYEGCKDLDVTTSHKEIFDRMTSKYLKDIAAALKAVKLSGQRFSNVDIVQLHADCHNRRCVKDKAREIEKANEKLKISVDGCKAFAANVPLKPLDDGMLAVFLSAASGLRCDPVYLQTAPHDVYPYLEMRDDKLYIRGNKLMSERATTKDKYVINIEIEEPFAKHILASVQKRAAAGQSFVFEGLINENHTKTMRNYSELVIATTAKSEALQRVTVVDFRKAHVTRDVKRYLAGEISFDQLEAKFHARGHSTAVLDNYYRMPETENDFIDCL